MGSYSKTVDGNKGGSAQKLVDDSHVCGVCKGRKYTMVASRRLSQSSTVYERRLCRECAVAAADDPIERDNVKPHSEKKTVSGTGYLRNKKRRRKASVE
jgi:hypothetical protein